MRGKAPTVAHRATLIIVIKSFRHKGLRQFYESGSKAGIIPTHADRLQAQLTALDAANDVTDLNLPGYELHSLIGDQLGRWAITVRANWRITFEFSDGNAEILDYEDYH